MTAHWKEAHLPAILPNYKLEDVFNADEFGLFFQVLPNKTLKSKGEKCSGGKHSKVRFTRMCAESATVQMKNCRYLSLERAKIRDASKTSSPCHVSTKHNQKTG